MGFHNWLNNQLIKSPLAAPALSVIVSVLCVDQPSWWSGILFFITIFLGLLSRKGVVMLCIVFGLIAGARHFHQLEKQQKISREFGSWWNGEVLLVSLPNRGQAFVKVIGDAEVKLQMWLPNNKFDWQIGQRLNVGGRLLSPSIPLNPQVFNENAWLHRKGVSGVLIARHCEVIESQSFRYLIHRFAHSVSLWIGNRITMGLEKKSDEMKIIRAMVLGEKPKDSEQLLENFRHSGAMHVFAVSGLHVMMVGSMIAIGVKILGFDRRVWIPCVILSMFFYALVTGMRPPAMRAAIMGSILLSGWLVQRKIVLINSLAASVIVVLIWDGHMLFRPGFQLSFGVLLAIALLGEYVKKYFKWISYVDPFLPRSLYSRWQDWNLRLRRKIQGAMVVASCAWIGSSPLTWIYFKLLAPISIFVSLPLVCILYLILIGSGISLLLGSLWAPLGLGVNKINGNLAGYSKDIVTYATKIPGGNIVARPWQNGERIVIYALPDGAAAVYIGIGGGVMLDVGSARDFKRNILPSLQKNGARIDSLILTHADTKHCGGVEKLLDFYDIKQCAIAEKNPRSRNFKKALNKINAMHISLNVLEKGSHLPLSPECWLELIDTGHREESLADDRCMVFRLNWRGTRILFTADTGYKFERRALNENIDVCADILVLGNHKNDNQLGNDFIKKVGAKMIVIGTEKPDLKHQNKYHLLRKGALTLEAKGNTIIKISQMDGDLGKIH